MCNLDSLTRGQNAMRHLFRIEQDRTGNLPTLPSIFPNTTAPVVHRVEGVHTLAIYR